MRIIKEIYGTTQASECSHWTSLVAQMVKNLPSVQEIWVLSLGWGNPLEKGMATHPVFLPGEFHGQRCVHIIKVQKGCEREKERELI